MFRKIIEGKQALAHLSYFPRVVIFFFFFFCKNVENEKQIFEQDSLCLSEKSVGNQFKEIKKRKLYEYLTNMFLLKVVIHPVTVEKPPEIMLFIFNQYNCFN
jgi:hypothetical protein